MSPKQNINLNVRQEKSVGQQNMGSFWERLKSISAERLAWLWLLIGFPLLPFTAWQIVNARKRRSLSCYGEGKILWSE